MRCPSCETPLAPATVDGETLLRCGGCGGEFSTHEALRRLLVAHSPAPGAPGKFKRPSPLSDPVRYRKCPGCGKPMLRKNFRDTSGVVVDVCAAHGLWFDGGELRMVLEFSSTGALAKAERDAEARRELQRGAEAFHARLRDAGPRHVVGRPAGGSAEALADLAMLALDVAIDALDD